MTEDSSDQTFSKLSRQQLVVYAKEFRKLYEETRHLRAALADRGQDVVGPDGLVGRYRIIELIGRGGTAQVFRAHDPGLEREVALKVLHSYFNDDPTFSERFRQEAQATAKLSHSNIVQIYDFGEAGGHTHIVTKYVRGGTLAQRLEGRMSLSELLSWAKPLASALDYAHQRGIVHRDLKPSNVLLEPDGTPVLSDFGIARVLASSAQLTLTKWTVGTPDYMSPEQALGRSVDHRSDLYSFGVRIYRLLLGRLPFQEETDFATMLAHIREKVFPPTEADPNLDRRVGKVLVKALAKKPDYRYQTATEMVRELASAST